MKPCLLLNNGQRIPQLGFGTFRAPKEAVRKAVQLALRVGYRRIDCSMINDNEKEVGKAIATSMRKLNLKREDIFVTSKFSCGKHAANDVGKACEVSLKNLGLEYLDLYLLHFPISWKLKRDEPLNVHDSITNVFERRKLEDTWKAMEALVSSGLVRSIGVTNFLKEQLQWLLKQCTIGPAVVQVEVNVHFPNRRLIEYCRKEGIVVEGCSPLGSPCFMEGQRNWLLDNEHVVEAARKHKKTPAQVLLRHGLRRGIVVIVRSVTAELIESYFDVFDFDLSHMEMVKVDSIEWSGPWFWNPE
ncbi:unnamed protein product [Taenia asiatica]|uniref:Aldo_ket_red domain-containing protein n=1 Tax=Taenia asiatica TaxID=60517 RepID=A0A0R3VZK0_TAEAS|nr:unnamed protein product [Taenia asiatica]